MASQTAGIQRLLAAEKTAAQKVSEARKRKNRRLKQAKEEAQQEIEKFKGEREKQFRDNETKQQGSRGETECLFKTAIFWKDRSKTILDITA